MNSFDLMRKLECVKTPAAAVEWIELCLKTRNTEGAALVDYMLGHFLWLYAEQISGEDIRDRFGLQTPEFHFKVAYEGFTERAGSGCGQSAMMVANYYLEGLPPVQRNTSEFLVWLKKAADLGYEPAIRELRAQSRSQ